MLGAVYLKLHPNHSAIFHVNFGLVLSFLKFILERNKSLRHYVQKRGKV